MFLVLIFLQNSRSANIWKLDLYKKLLFCWNFYIGTEICLQVSHARNLFVSEIKMQLSTTWKRDPLNTFLYETICTSTTIFQLLQPLKGKKVCCKQKLWAFVRKIVAIVLPFYKSVLYKSVSILDGKLLCIVELFIQYFMSMLGVIVADLIWYWFLWIIKCLETSIGVTVFS